MELTAERMPIPSYMHEGARHGRRIVLDALGALDPNPRPLAAGDADYSEAATSFLAHVMFTVQIANGLHPKSAVEFVLDETRGGELARGFLLAGTVEICCDYCAQLMAGSMAAGVATQMTAVHSGEAASQWHTLWLALTGPPF